MRSGIRDAAGIELLGHCQHTACGLCGNHKACKLDIIHAGKSDVDDIPKHQRRPLLLKKQLGTFTDEFAPQPAEMCKIIPSIALSTQCGFLKLSLIIKLKLAVDLTVTANSVGASEGLLSRLKFFGYVLFTNCSDASALQCDLIGFIEYNAYGRIREVHLN